MFCAFCLFSLLNAPDLLFSKNPDLFPTLVYSRNGAFPSVEEHLSEYVQLES